MLLKLIEYLSITGIAYALFLITALQFKKENKSANRILSFILFLITLDLLSINFKYNDLSKLMLASVFFYGSLINFYTQVQTGIKSNKFKNRVFILIPPITAILFYLTPYSPAKIILLYLGYLYFLINLIISYLRVKIFNKQIRDFFSSIKYLKQIWLKVILLASIFVLSSSLINDLIFNPLLLPKEPSVILTMFTLLFAVIFIFTLGIISINQPEITNKIKSLKEEPAYNNQKIETEKLNRYSDIILSVLEKEKLYLMMN